MRDRLRTSSQTIACNVDVHETLQNAHSTMLQVIEAQELYHQLEHFRERKNSKPMFKWACMYVEMVLTLLQFIQATRQDN